MKKLVITLGILGLSTAVTFAASTGSLSTSPQTTISGATQSPVQSPALAHAQVQQVAAQAQTAMPAKTIKSASGNILVTPDGKTLYSFDKDTNGASTCDAKCLKIWPAFHASAKDVAAGDWTKVKTLNGGEMWAYKGKPLYTYAKDKKSGDELGNGMGGKWHIVKM